ncbi:hypothetical protein ASG40_11645 [Methylobacterium sp. Leaf399]|uniref:HK97-gp10 family putative phage morphogenesis protein n=1 Tax=Methylobacterium sp. Leaf399 TaxID=1736364 RepID=UPI0006F38027|nr:HK97-gp10 family putative phage morphogenesis protein [Methylobacterium sp. Leaf399]KQT08525.1 hypothetical protein ASG40_11645 [Methylobacterium sp. Leaf399]
MAIDGRERLLKKLAALSPKTREAIGKAVRQGADEIVAAQKRLAPKRTGALAASIVATSGGAAPKYSQGGRTTGQASDPELTVVVSAGNSKVRYAHLVEFGTAPHENKGLFEGSQNPGAKPAPFFYPVARAYRKRVKARITRATKKAAREAASS